MLNELTDFRNHRSAPNVWTRSVEDGSCGASWLRLDGTHLAGRSEVSIRVGINDIESALHAGKELTLAVPDGPSSTNEVIPCAPPFTNQKLTAHMSTSIRPDPYQHAT